LLVFRTIGDAEPIVVADLGLQGTGEAVAALRRCTRWVANREAARTARERRNDYIARDPFVETPQPAAAESGQPR
jgi:hypothetical protein